MPYVQRDAEGNINGLLRWPAKPRHEFLPDNDPEVVAFRAPPDEADLIDRQLSVHPVLTRLAHYLATKEGRTAREVLDDIKGQSGEVNIAEGQPR